jgi:outer membrane protein assembly factor BamB
MRKAHLLFAATLLIGGCSIFRGDGKADEDPYVNAEAVLNTEDVILADPVLAGQAIIVPPPFNYGDWRQAGGEPDHALHHVSLPGELERLWRTKAISKKAKDAPVTSPPVVDDRYAYLIDAVGRIAAFDLQTGDEVWSRSLAPQMDSNKRSRFVFWDRTQLADLGFGGGAAVVDGSLYVTSGFGFVAALDAATGELQWQTEAPGPVRNPPTVAEGLVFAVTISNEVIALEAETGEEVWSYQSFEESARVLASAAPAVAGESVIVPFSSGEVISFDAATGRVQWQAVISRTSRLDALSTLGDISGSPVVDRGAVFAVSQSGQMAGIDFRTGAVAWEAPVGGFHTPWLAGETLFSISNRGELSAVNRADGKIRWNTPLPTYKNPKKRKNRIIWAGPVLAGGKLLVTSTEGEMLALSPQDGEVIERIRLSAGTTLPPVVADDVAYVLNEKGQIEAYGPSTAN